MIPLAVQQRTKSILLISYNIILDTKFNSENRPFLLASVFPATSRVSLWTVFTRWISSLYLRNYIATWCLPCCIFLLFLPKCLVCLHFNIVTRLIMFSYGRPLVIYYIADKDGGSKMERVCLFIARIKRKVPVKI